jgi:hypothetical protein
MIYTATVGDEVTALMMCIIDVWQEEVGRKST